MINESFACLYLLPQTRSYIESGIIFVSFIHKILEMEIQNQGRLCIFEHLENNRIDSDNGQLVGHLSIQPATQPHAYINKHLKLHRTNGRK